MAEQSDHYSNTENDLVNVIVLPEKLLQAVKAIPPRRSDSPTRRQMEKVPSLLRLENNNRQDYEPLVVSFGPYHHGKSELQAAETFKLRALEMVVADSKKDVLLFYTRVLGLVNDARNCYIEDSTLAFDDPTFAQMMLLDACFLAHFILSSQSCRYVGIQPKYLGDLVSAIVYRDMFLLENQIPFRILKLVMFLGYGDQGEKLIDQFLNIVILGEYKRIEVASSVDKQPFHILDAFRLILVSDPDGSSNGEPAPINRGPRPSLRWLKHIGKKCIRHQSHCWGKDGTNDQCSSTKKYVHSFRSVTDLTSKGIQFKQSCGDSLKSICFKSGYFFARLEIPIWFVSIYTKVFFTNMIAYELCPSSNTRQEVTSYIDFMKSLIDNPSDVKELREKKILFITLASDEEVVNLFKELNTYGCRNWKIFHKVKQEIDAHYNNKAKTWLAELLHTYFLSPWKLIGLLAATLLLVLTFLQTYSTLNYH